MKRIYRKVWTVFSYLFLILILALSTQFLSELVLLISIFVLIAIDFAVYRKRFYLLANNPGENLDERENHVQKKAYWYSYMIIATAVLIVGLVFTIFNDLELLNGLNFEPIVSSLGFILFYFVYKLPIAVVSWIEK